ncbi:uncharacterized protein NEMAJ01_1594 [Nematocida major]|uniref:uncharacterized protein n=1 Tax=Nematocida major TaxID=1912982 RepID=UPI0020081F2B|nr:uncharacterized protein NEMAJ01_1594 [Nematocida major]KAH9386698.1 hypothetical protein NEMAJ01_1594 [Nematocida major]
MDIFVDEISKTLQNIVSIKTPPMEKEGEMSDGAPLHTPSSLSSDPAASSSEYRMYISRIHVLGEFLPEGGAHPEESAQKALLHEPAAEETQLRVLLEAYRKLDACDGGPPPCVSEEEYKALYETLKERRALVGKPKEFCVMELKRALIRKMLSVDLRRPMRDIFHVLLGIVQMHFRVIRSHAQTLTEAFSRLVIVLRSRIFILEDMESTSGSSFTVKEACTSHLVKYVALTNIIEHLQKAHKVCNYEAKLIEKAIAGILQTEEYQALCNVACEARKEGSADALASTCEADSEPSTQSLGTCSTGAPPRKRDKGRPILRSILRWVEREKASTEHLLEETSWMFGSYKWAPYITERYVNMDALRKEAKTDARRRGLRIRYIEETLARAERGLQGLCDVLSILGTINACKEEGYACTPPFKSIFRLLDVLRDALRAESASDPAQDIDTYQKGLIQHIHILVPLSYFLPTDQTVFMGYLLLKHGLIKRAEDAKLYYAYDTLTYKSDSVAKLQALLTERVSDKVQRFQEVLQREGRLKEMAHALAKRVQTHTVQYLIRKSPRGLVQKVADGIKAIYISPESTSERELQKLLGRASFLKKIAEYVLPSEPYISFSRLKRHLVKNMSKKRKKRA